MKKIYFLLGIIFSLFITGCSKYGYVSLNYPQEPVAYFPEDVKSIAVVNRSLTKEEDRDGILIEAITTTEIAGLDQLASDECLKAVYDGLQGYRGMKIIFPKKLRMYGTGTREVPEMLDWKFVEKFCEENKADALLVLESFDSNTDLLTAVATEQVTSLITTGRPKPTPPREIRMNVSTYWRLYDPVTQSIIDQYQHSSFLTFNTVGGAPPAEALSQTAYEAGRAYTNRFLPSYYTVRRELYSRGKGSDKHKFRSGYRRAEVANWEGAVEIWSDMVGYAKRKTAGRACLNIAVAYEVLGNTDLALEWAQRAYEDYNNKLGRDYAKILLRRRRLE